MRFSHALFVLPWVFAATPVKDGDLLDPAEQACSLADPAERLQGKHS